MEKKKKKQSRKEQPSDRRKKISLSAMVNGFFMVISLFLLFYLLSHIIFNTQHLIILK